MVLAFGMGMSAAQPVTAQPATAQPAPVDQLVATGAEAGVDPALIKEVVRRAEHAGYTPDQTAQLLRPAVGLAQAQLPADGVLRKALEGLAKGVPAARVHPVLRRIQSSTEQAGSLISTWAAKPEVRAMMQGGEAPEPLDRPARNELVQSVAQAGLQGTPSDVVQELLETLPGQTQRRPILPAEVTATVQVLPEVMSSGTSAQAAIELLTSAVDAGYGPANVRQLPTALQAARQQSQQPMDVLARGAARAIAQGTPAADVLGNLFNRGTPGNSPGNPPGSVGPPGSAAPSGNVPGLGAPPNDIPPNGAPPGTPPSQGGRPPTQGRPPGQGGSSS